MKMKLEVYKNIMSVIESFHGRNYECEELLQQKFPDIMPETLGSMYEIFYQKKMKRLHPKYNRLSKDLYARYKTAVENGEPVNILVRMADEIELSPALLARLIVEEYYKEAEEEYITKVVDDSDNSGRCIDSIRYGDTDYVLSDDDKTEISSSSNTDSKASDESVQVSQKQQSVNANTKSLEDKHSLLNESVKATPGTSKRDKKPVREKHKIVRSNTTQKAGNQTKNASAKEEECTRITVSQLINDTTLIKDKDLAYEVFMCHVEDDQYGPAMDCYRQSLGHQYEVRLLQWVKKNNLVVQDEAALRKYGFDKTPDVKLDLPIAVNGAPIMWIESKAIFGDEEKHQTYYKDQYIKYWNRFGPGLVIYWFGYLETIATAEERRILIRHDLPTDIKQYNPEAVKVRRFTEKPFGVS